MLPAIARYAIATYTTPGDLVVDPMAGIGTITVEAVHLGRDAVAVEYERRWARLAAANLEHAAAQGATGHGEIIRGDARRLAELLPDHLRGEVSLVLTSPPYGSSTHGHVREYGGRHGRVAKVNHRYGDDQRNLAHVSHDQLASGFTQILAGCVPLLRPGGHVVVTARPYRRHGTLVDIAGMVITAAADAGLRLVDRCPALIAAVRHGRVVTRASFFQLRNVRSALAQGDPQWLAQHETVLAFQAHKTRQ
jgi:tRNA G10  N-methylase Trm11